MIETALNPYVWSKNYIYCIGHCCFEVAKHGRGVDAAATLVSMMRFSLKNYTVNIQFRFYSYHTMGWPQWITILADIWHSQSRLRVLGASKRRAFPTSRFPAFLSYGSFVLRRYCPLAFSSVYRSYYSTSNVLTCRLLRVTVIHEKQSICRPINSEAYVHCNWDFEAIESCS